MSKKRESDQNQSDSEKMKIVPLTEGPMKGGRNKPPTTPRPAPPPGLNIKKK